MYKNQLQELAQRSCFNLPWYTCIREGPDHAPRFKATVNFNGEVFESPNFCNTLRQAEHSAAEVALNSLSNRAPTQFLAAKILDETGVFKNLLQEVSQRVGAALPRYTTVRSGLGHLPVFTCTVQLAGITFTGEPAKTKKQAEKNAAMSAWSSLKLLVKQDASSSSETDTNNDEQQQITIARALLNYRLKDKITLPNSPNPLSPFPNKFLTSPLPTRSLPITSKILPLIHPNSIPQTTSILTLPNDTPSPSRFPPPEMHTTRHQKFPAVDATPYVPIRLLRPPYHRAAQPVTIRTAIPVFSAPPFPPSSNQPSQASTVHIAPPVRIKQAVPVFSTPPVRVEETSVATTPATKPPVQVEAIGNIPICAAPQVCPQEPPVVTVPLPTKASTQMEYAVNKTAHDMEELIITCQDTFSLEAKPSLHITDVDHDGGNDQEAGKQGVK